MCQPIGCMKQLTLLQENFDVNDHSQANITAFKTYIIEYWIRKVTPQRISVFDFSHGTNNGAESYHSKLKTIVRQHKPNIYTFLTHLNNLITDTTKGIEHGCWLGHHSSEEKEVYQKH